MRFVIDRGLSEMRSTLACRRGAVAIIFAFAAMILVVAIGMGVDLWQAYAVKARLQSAVDAASLAIASTDRTQFTQAQLDARVQAYVTANYPTSALGKPGTPTLSYGSTENIINISGTASVPTSLMRIIGIDTLSVSATGQVKAAWPNIDFYLLLDSSPSMAIAATQAGIDLMISKTNGTNQQESGDKKAAPLVAMKGDQTSSGAVKVSGTLIKTPAR
jgi:Flp pilus assembly protein TadG